MTVIHDISKTYFGAQQAEKISQLINSGIVEIPGTTSVIVLEKDEDGMVTKCAGETKPTDEEAGFAKHCEFLDTNSVDGASGVYLNNGSATSCAFELVGTVGTGDIGSDEIEDESIQSEDIKDGDIDTADLKNSAVTAAKLATDAVETAKIKDLNVTKSKLAATITPSHILKFVVLGSTVTGVTLTGLLADDLVESILADGTVTMEVVVAADTLPSDPADTTYIKVWRATA